MCVKYTVLNISLTVKNIIKLNLKKLIFLEDVTLILISYKHLH